MTYHNNEPTFFAPSVTQTPSKVDPSEYNITFLHNFMAPDGGASFSLTSDTDRKLLLTKEQAFEQAQADTSLIATNSGTHRPKCDADRAYLHYIIDCWLDSKPVALQPSDLK